MTDLEKFKALLEEWEVPYEEGETHITLYASASDDRMVIGYDGFVTDVTFDDNGGFVRIGIWE